MRFTVTAIAISLVALSACSDDDATPADAGVPDSAAADQQAAQDAAADLKPDSGFVCAPPAAKGSFHALSAKEAAKAVSMCRYRGKVVLVVNIAAKCGFTPQLANLVKLQQAHAGKGFTVLGFYSDQFFNRGGTASERKSCEDNYGVNFPTFDMLNVNPPNEHPLFTWLKAQPNGIGKVTWNFEKWLLGKDGKLIKRWKTNVIPDSSEITSAIKVALAK